MGVGGVGWRGDEGGGGRARDVRGEDGWCGVWGIEGGGWREE